MCGTKSGTLSHAALLLTYTVSFYNKEKQKSMSYNKMEKNKTSEKRNKESNSTTQQHTTTKPIYRHTTVTK